MSAWYNENDPFAAAWLRELIRAELIPAGIVDERSIADVRAADLEGYAQCHFFAGIGGWPYALRLAGWDDARPVWTGSCPCQPFSVAGKRKGFADERDLWPVWFQLIRERRPAVVYGEQVARAADWLGRVRSNLETVAYAVGAIPIEAASANSHQLRDRYWFVAYDDLAVVQREPSAGQQPQPQQDNRDRAGPLAGGHGEGVREQPGRRDGASRPGAPIVGQDAAGDDGRAVACGDGGDRDRRTEIEERRPEGRIASVGAGRGDVVDLARLGWGEGLTEAELRRWGSTAAIASIRGCQFIECPDGKWRALPPSRVRWLGNGIPARVAKLRGFGNAIDPRPAAAFIKAAMHAMTAFGSNRAPAVRSERAARMEPVP